MSAIKFAFIYKSKGESPVREGAIFTSRIQGLSSSSSMISNPSSSKKLDLNSPGDAFDTLLESNIYFSTVINDLIIASYILLHISSKSTPSFVKWDYKADKDHLFPVSCSLAFILGTKVSLFLFIE